jgi:hypothetical protein
MNRFQPLLSKLTCAATSRLRQACDHPYLVVHSRTAGATGQGGVAGAGGTPSVNGFEGAGKGKGKGPAVEEQHVEAGAYTRPLPSST